MKLNASELESLYRVADALHAGNGIAAAAHFIDIYWPKLEGRFGRFRPVEVYRWMGRI